MMNNLLKMERYHLLHNWVYWAAGTLNQYNAKQRTSVASAMRHEEHLKESIANVSHDLRTLLTVILGHLQILQKYDSTEEQSQHILAAYRKAEQMNELISSFYDLSILDSKQLIPQKESVNISNLLIDSITENAPLLECKNIRPSSS